MNQSCTLLRVLLQENILYIQTFKILTIIISSIWSLGRSLTELKPCFLAILGFVNCLKISPLPLQKMTIYVSVLYLCQPFLKAYSTNVNSHKYITFVYPLCFTVPLLQSKLIVLTNWIKIIKVRFVCSLQTTVARLSKR